MLGMSQVAVLHQYHYCILSHAKVSRVKANVSSSRRLHASRLRSHRRIRRLRRLVLPMPWLSLRHLRPSEEGACAVKLGGPAIFFPGGGDRYHWLRALDPRIRSSGGHGALLFFPLYCCWLYAYSKKEVERSSRFTDNVYHRI